MQTKIEQALEVLTVNFLSDLPPITDDEFSEKFKKRMEKLIRRWEKPYYILINTAAKRVACIIVCMIVAISALTISVKAFLPDVWNIIIEWFDEYISVGFKTDADSTPDEIEEIRAPKYVPEGLEMSGSLRTPALYQTDYYKDGVVICTVKQHTYKRPLLLDDESFIQNVIVFQYEGIMSTSDGVRYLAWEDGKYYYVIESDGSLTDDELIAIAESIYE